MMVLRFTIQGNSSFYNMLTTHDGWLDLTILQYYFTRPTGDKVFKNYHDGQSNGNGGHGTRCGVCPK